jgi:hypothetical protein
MNSRAATSCPVRMAALVLLSAFINSSVVLAAGTLTGTVRFERIKGTDTYWTDLHEWNAYLTPSGSMFADPVSARCDHGSYGFSHAAGNYTLYVNKPEAFARPKLITDVQIVDGQVRYLNPTFNLDYSCYYKQDWPGGWDHTWYQTFVATGTSINKIVYSCAGSSASSIAVTLLRDTGGSILDWTPVGETKASGISWGENWVGYRSGQLPTIPGHRYAVRLAGQGTNPAFSPYWRTDNGDGYALGRAYDRDGQPLNKDLLLLVFSDNDGTVIPYMKTTGLFGKQAWWEWQWGQTFKATGSSLAAVDFYFTNEGNWNMQMTFKVFATPPNGTGGPPSNPVGLVKRARGAWEAGAACMGIGYAPGEVPLTPGQTYYIEMTPYGGPIGYTAWRFDDPADAYPDGHAYANRIAQPGIDLSMTIMEHAAVGEPAALELDPTSFTRQIRRGASLDPDVFTVRNAGGGLLAYQITDDAAWLTVSPTQGVVADQPVPIAVHYQAAGLAVGSYTGTIEVTGQSAANSPQHVHVFLTVEPPEFAPGDYDEDGDVDMSDFSHLQSCLSGPGVSIQNSACLNGDLDGDKDVDTDDVLVFLRCLSGPGVTADPLCADSLP